MNKFILRFRWKDFTCFKVKSGVKKRFTILSSSHVTETYFIVNFFKIITIEHLLDLNLVFTEIQVETLENIKAGASSLPVSRELKRFIVRGINQRARSYKATGESMNAQVKGNYAPMEEQ